MPAESGGGPDGETPTTGRRQAGAPPFLGLALYLFAIGMIAVFVALVLLGPIAMTIDRGRLAIDQQEVAIPIRTVMTRVAHVPAATDYGPGIGARRGYRIFNPEHWRVEFDIIGPDGVPPRGRGTLGHAVEPDDLLPAAYVARRDGGPGAGGRVLFEPVEPPTALDWALVALCGAAGIAVPWIAARWLWQVLDPPMVLSPQRRRAWFALLEPGRHPPVPVTVALIAVVGGVFGVAGLLLCRLALDLLSSRIAVVLG